MTINEAIAAADGLRNNQISADIKRAMLSELDGRIYREVMDPIGNDFNGYNADTDEATQLLAPFPYDGLYVTYLEMEIARINGEMPRYNNAAIRFNEKYEAFKRWYNRTYPRKSAGIVFPTRR
ncbi:MAG: hypothetical protein UHG68_04625 [Clostridia bacterium]|nr:hypothetical protein [Clostridia bacterium]